MALAHCLSRMHGKLSEPLSKRQRLPIALGIVSLLPPHGIQVAGLGGKYLYLLSHITDPKGKSLEGWQSSGKLRSHNSQAIQAMVAHLYNRDSVSVINLSSICFLKLPSCAGQSVEESVK